MLDNILGARPHADAPLAAARLAPVGVHRGPLQITAVRDGDGDVFHLDEILEMDLASVFDDLGAALVAEFLLDVLQLLHDDAAQLFVGRQDIEILGDFDLDTGQLIQDLLDLHAGEALELHLDDGLGLAFGELEGADQTIAGFARGFGCADQLDDGVQIFQGFLKAQQNVLALARFAQQVIGAPPDHVDTVIDKALQDIGQAQLARLPVDDGQHDDAEVDLELGVLVEIVQDDFGLLAALQLEHDAHAVAIAFVANFRDALDLFVVYQAGGRLNEPRLVDLVWDLGDYDRFAIFSGLLGGGFSAQLQCAAPLGEVFENALAAENESS